MRNQEGGRKGRRGTEKEEGRACRNSIITVYFRNLQLRSRWKRIMYILMSQEESSR